MFGGPAIVDLQCVDGDEARGTLPKAEGLAPLCKGLRARRLDHPKQSLPSGPILENNMQEPWSIAGEV